MITRRKFLKAVVCAGALALSPVLLNTISLRLAKPVDAVARFRVGGTGVVYGHMIDSESGVERFMLDETITVLDDEYLDVYYTYYADGRSPEIALIVGT